MKINKLRKKIEEEEIDTFISLRNAGYLSDTKASSAVITNENKTVVLCGRMNFYKAGEETSIKDLRTFAKTETPTRKDEKLISSEGIEKAISKVLKEFESKKIGFDYLNSEILKKLKNTHDAEYSEKSDLIWDLRKIKTSKEIEKVRKASKIAEIGMKKAERLIEPGRTELKIVAEIEYEMRKKGAEGISFDTMVASGKNSIFPHSNPTEKKLEKNELVIVDLGAKWRNYNSDMTRTFSISPTEKQKEILKVTNEAQESVLEKISSGTKINELDRTAREIFSEHGYEEYYVHSLGHGIGLEVHEKPRISKSSEGELKEGMVITIEPGIYLENVGGCRLEDIILVKKDGCEKITSTDFC